MRILLVDDHPVVRKGLMELLAEKFNRAVFGEAKDACEALEHVRKQNWDIVVLDISLPGRSGLDILKDIKQLRPRTPVFVLSIHPEDQFAMRVLRAGGAGYMTKDMAPEELVQAIRKVLSGGKYVSSRLAEKLALELASPAERPSHKALSDREFQVMRMIASGKTVSEIADELILSVKTVSTYRQRALLKMGMKTNAELTRYAIKNGLVD
jgi:DNA-binding NarL/FixJ family response regulator